MNDFQPDGPYGGGADARPEQEICEIIIEFKDENNPQIEFIKKHGIIRDYFPMINSYVVELPRNYVVELEKDRNVVSVYKNTRITAQMNNGRRAVRVDAAQRSGFDGSGITIAFLDTGIAPVKDFTYPRNRILTFRDFVNGRTSPYDDNGHGTHVAGIAAGNGSLSKGKYCGIAYNANIIAVKILDGDGHGSSSLALSGLQWVLDNREKYNIRIVNLSIGASESGIKDPLVRAVNAVWDRGVIVTVASGNNGPQKRSVTSPGTSKKAITVGASDDNSQVQIWGDTLVNFSGRGPTGECVIKPDLLAPGAKIVSVLSPESLLSKDKTKVVDDGHARLSGTSMSTPIVAGAVALLLQKHPSLAPDEVKLALKLSCSDLSYPQNHQGWGLLNIDMLMEVEESKIAIMPKPSFDL